MHTTPSRYQSRVINHEGIVAVRVHDRVDVPARLMGISPFPPPPVPLLLLWGENCKERVHEVGCCSRKLNAGSRVPGVCFPFSVARLGFLLCRNSLF